MTFISCGNSQTKRPRRRSRRARALKIAALTVFCSTLESYLENLLTWYDVLISTGPLEGLNNKIKTLKRQAYGFRNDEYFKLKILGIKRTRYALVG